METCAKKCTDGGIVKHLRKKGKGFFLTGFFGLIFQMMTCLAFAEGIIADHAAVLQTALSL